MPSREELIAAIVAAEAAEAEARRVRDEAADAWRAATLAERNAYLALAAFNKAELDTATGAKKAEARRA